MDDHSTQANAPREQAGAPTFELGAQVRLKGPQRYLKTADPMPMLRPPDLVDPEELGQVVAIKARQQLAVRFRRGTFLIDVNQLSG